MNGIGIWNLQEGTRVSPMPHTDAWISGQRWGKVTKVGSKWVHVRMDSGKNQKFLIEGAGGFNPRVPGLRRVR